MIRLLIPDAELPVHLSLVDPRMPGVVWRGPTQDGAE